MRDLSNRIIFRMKFPKSVAGYPTDDTNPSVLAKITNTFSGMIKELPVSRERFDIYRVECGYSSTYVSYMGPERLNEKLLEHHLSVELTDPQPGEVLMDVGSAESPFADAMKVMIGVRIWKLDPSYSKGVHGEKIGAFAQNVPLENNSVDIMVLHCAIDHFEGNSDTLFIVEAARLLRPGGRLCILPIYFSDQHSNITDPNHFKADIRFDQHARIHRVLGHANRFGRFYSPSSFLERLIQPVEGKLFPTLYHFVGERELIPNNYCRWGLVLRKGD